MRLPNEVIIALMTGTTLRHRRSQVPKHGDVVSLAADDFSLSIIEGYGFWRSLIDDRVWDVRSLDSCLCQRLLIAGEDYVSPVCGCRVKRNCIIV